MQSKKQSKGVNPHISTFETGGHTISMLPNPMFDIPKNVISPVIPPQDQSVFPIQISRSFAEEIRSRAVSILKEGDNKSVVLLSSSHGQLAVEDLESKEDFFEDVHSVLVSLVESPVVPLYYAGIDPISDVTLSTSSYSWHMMASTGMIIYDTSGSITYQVEPIDNGNK